MGFLKSHPFLVAAVIMVLTVGAIQVLPDFDTWGKAAEDAVLAVVVLAVMAAVGGIVAIKPSGTAMGYAFRKGCYILVVSLVLSVLSFLGCIMEPSVSVRSDVAMMLVAYIVMCLAVGIFEEGLFRGVVFGALLSKMGGTHSGIIWAALISSLLFGVAHVYPYFLSGEVSDALTLAQAVLKVIQSGMVGFFLAAVYLRTRNLWAVALIHALTDLLGFLSLAFFELSTNIAFVYTDPTYGIAVVVVNSITVLAYIPAVVYACRAFNSADVPNLGIWRETWEPVVPAENPKRKAQN